jgi:predicted transcriptional regulator
MAPKKPDGGLPEKPLTETELEMMNVIWRIGPCTVNQILESLPPERPLAYTSVSTIVRILEQKHYVTSEKAGRGHLYAAAVHKDDYQQKSIRYMLENVFDSTPAALVRQLLQSKSLKQSDLHEIRSLLEKKV